MFKDIIFKAAKNGGGKKILFMTITLLSFTLPY